MNSQDDWTKQTRGVSPTSAVKTDSNNMGLQERNASLAYSSYLFMFKRKGVITDQTTTTTVLNDDFKFFF